LDWRGELVRDAEAVARDMLAEPLRDGESPAARMQLVQDLYACGLFGPTGSRWESRWFRFRVWLAEKLLRALRIDLKDLGDA
jgi:hypothetical protein